MAAAATTDQSQIKNIVKQLKEELIFSSGKDTNYIGQVWQLIKRDEMWPDFRKILTQQHSTPLHGAKKNQKEIRRKSIGNRKGNTPNLI